VASRPANGSGPHSRNSPGSNQTCHHSTTPSRPELTDGAVTVTSICTEAGVSRASYYRSPTAPVIKTLLTAPETARPELEELRAEVKRLRKPNEPCAASTPLNSAS
jgi:hypothetical protein